jgi:hypothetical protein
MDRNLYKIEIWVLKTIPFILALFGFINSILKCVGITFVPMAYFGSISLIPFIFLYLSSFVFKFCIWHRIPLYYIATVELFNLIDYWFLPHITNSTILIIYCLLFGAFSIICGLLKYFKHG